MMKKKKQWRRLTKKLTSKKRWICQMKMDHILLICSLLLYEFNMKVINNKTTTTMRKKIRIIMILILIYKLVWRSTIIRIMIREIVIIIILIILIIIRIILMCLFNITLHMSGIVSKMKFGCLMMTLMHLY
jgi:hypothetical protein